MKKFLVAFSILAIAGAVTGCSSERRTTTSTRETVQSVPTAPVVVERSSTRTETRTTE